jgi:hypothetical protein
MAGLVPAIHDFDAERSPNTWMPGTSAGHDEEWMKVGEERP